MDESIFTLVIRFTDKLQSMAALASSCKEAVQAYKNPELWCGEVTVTPYMIRCSENRAQFLKWLSSVRRNPNLHVRLWQAMQWLLADCVKDYAILISAVTTACCSQDLFMGLTKHPLMSIMDDREVCRLIAEHFQRSKSVAVDDDDAYVVLTDGPVPAGPFSFSFAVTRDFASAEFCIGYFPWPPIGNVFSWNDLDMSAHPEGSLYCEVDELELVGLAADFELSMSGDRSVHLRNVSLQCEVRVGIRMGVSLESSTGAYGVYCYHNRNSVVMTTL